MNETTNDMYSIHQYEQAVLTKDIPEKQLKAGDVGTVVDVHEGEAERGEAEGYSLEFFTLTGETVAVVTVKAESVRPVSAEDRIHVRS